VDEVHSLHRLPALYETETEGRKYGIKLIQGTQGKTQYEEYYDRLSKAMLAAPKLKLFFRCGEPESARWISDTIGEYEVEKPRIATTASVEDRGRDALNYSTTTEHHQAVSKEEIMCLPDLHGYWKYGDAVVPFRLQLAHVKIVTRGYIPRELPRVEVNLSALQPGPSDGRHKSPNEQSDKQSKRAQDRKQHEHRIVEIETENVISSVVTGPETAYEEAAQEELAIVEEKTGTASEMTSEEMEVEAELD